MVKSKHLKHNADHDRDASAPPASSDAARVPARLALGPSIIWPLNEIDLIDSLVRGGDDIFSETDDLIPGTDIKLQVLGG
jgi:hypothetical protein